MRTPKEYTENLRKGIITTQMLSDALYSVNKRAKNYRNAKRKSYGRYADSNEKIEKGFYEKKERLLSVVEPVCIHREHVGYERVRIRDTMPGWKDILACEAIRGTIVWANSYIDRDADEWDADYDYFFEGKQVWFFDYIVPEKPLYKYYLYYEVGERTFHTPVADPSGYDLPVIPIGRVVTEGDDFHDLISVQFVDKLIDLIDAGGYTLELEEPRPPVFENRELPFAPDYSRSFYIGGEVLANWFAAQVKPKSVALRIEPSDKRKEELRKDAEARFARRHRKIQRGKNGKGKRSRKWQHSVPSVGSMMPDRPSAKLRIDSFELSKLLVPMLPASLEECIEAVRAHFVTDEFLAHQARRLSEYDYVEKMVPEWRRSLLEEYGYMHADEDAGV